MQLMRTHLKSVVDKSRVPLILILLPVFFIISTGLQETFASSPQGQSRTATKSEAAIPPAYGKVIYHHSNPGAPKLYIIGMGHRDTFTRSNGSKTADIQVQLYRIGEWLIRNPGIDMLLPEGYFEPGQTENKLIHTVALEGAAAPLDDASLEQELGGARYVNAEKLLMRSYGVPARQVEDNTLYEDIIGKLKQLGQKTRNAFDAAYGKLELDYLQEMRTAAILSKIPEATKEPGRDGSGNAILTIGASHISEIIEWLGQNKLIVRSPAFSPFKDYTADLDLNQKFDVTVILPKTIADDGELLGAMNLASYFASPAVTAAAKTSAAPK